MPRRAILVTATAILSALVSIRFIDQTVALSSKILLTEKVRFEHLPSIPDLLTLIVVVIAGVSWYSYAVLTVRHQFTFTREFFKHLGSSVLLAYLLKTLLQFAFGRVPVRTYLADPAIYGFKWFGWGDGFTCFPSGHMAVFCACALTFLYFYPGWKVTVFAFLCLLACSLIISDYHFVSDTIAGAYTGWISQKIVQWVFPCVKSQFAQANETAYSPGTS